MEHFDLPQTMGSNSMKQKKDRDRVVAEITLPHLLRLANEHGCAVSREQALAFFNQQGRAFEMWKQMMQAGENFIARSLLGQDISPECASAGISLRTLRTWLTVTPTLVWRHSFAVLRRVPIGFFRFRAYRYPGKLFSRINRLWLRRPRDTGFHSKRDSKLPRQLG